jgi:hypothetical protein
MAGVRHKGEAAFATLQLFFDETTAGEAPTAIKLK